MIPKKVRYVPGLISLLGLPILLLLFGPEDKIQHNAYKFNLPSNEIDTTEEMYTESYVHNEIKKRKVVQIDLGDNDYFLLDEKAETLINNKKLQLIQNEMERLQFTHDTTTVLKVEFGDRDNYGEFVWLLNLALIYRFKHYSFVDDDLYFFAEPAPIDYSKLFPVEPLYIDQTQIFTTPSYKEPTKWEIFLQGFQYKLEEIIFVLKNNLLLSSGFLILIIIPATIQIFMRRNRAYS